MGENQEQNGDGVIYLSRKMTFGGLVMLIGMLVSAVAFPIYNRADIDKNRQLQEQTNNVIRNDLLRAITLLEDTKRTVQEIKLELARQENGSSGD